jgi:hypothetical protein
MTDVDHWGVLTIGTGLGNACFYNHAREATKSEIKREAKAAKKAEKAEKGAEE